MLHGAGIPPFLRPIGSQRLMADKPLLMTEATSLRVLILCWNPCLICASFGMTFLQNADSARRCRFRNSQQKRASDLDLTDVWIPKLDVAGSSPVFRSISFSITYSVLSAAQCSFWPSAAALTE